MSTYICLKDKTIQLLFEVFKEQLYDHGSHIIFTSGEYVPNIVIGWFALKKLNDDLSTFLNRQFQKSVHISVSELFKMAIYLPLYEEIWPFGS